MKPITDECNIIRRLCYKSDKAVAEEGFKDPAIYALFIELYDALVALIIKNKRKEDDSRRSKKKKRVFDVAKEMEDLKTRA